MKRQVALKSKNTICSLTITLNFYTTGQIELYTHMPVMRQLVQTLNQWDFRVCGVFLIDSQFLVDCSKFFAGILTALSAMIQLEIPHINVMSKMDLLSKKQMKQVDRWVDGIFGK